MTLTHEFLVGLTVNAISAAAGPVASVLGRGRLKLSDDILASLEARASHLAAPTWAELAKAGVSTETLDSVVRFMHTPEASGVSRGLMISVILRQEKEEVPRLEGELAALLSIVAGVGPIDARTISRRLTEMLVNLFSDCVGTLGARSYSALEQMRALAASELISGYVRDLSADSMGSTRLAADEARQAFARFNEYLRVTETATAKLVPAHFDTQRRVPIDDIYIEPNFVTANTGQYGFFDRQQKGEELEIPFNRAIRRTHRVVVLGDPGAGKSTLTQKITHDLCSTQQSAEHDAPLCLPFTVVMREFEEAQQRKPLSIIEFISQSVNVTSQVPVQPRWIEYALRSGRALVMFDGLDELNDVSRKQAMAVAIGNFATLYPLASVIITSREVGYDEARLDPDRFALLRICPLDATQVGDYARKWFILDDSLSAAERASVPTHFLSESATVNDLRSNPLMLSLLCNVYRGQRFIPRNRADLYESCAEMLFDKWDQLRGVKTDSVMRTDVRFALAHVAYWIYTTPRLATGVRHRELERELVSYLLKKRFEHEADAEVAVSRLLRSWSGRAWILTDFGASGLDKIYRFTHRTFLEYFAAVHLERTHPSPGKLWKKIAPRLSVGEWDVIAELSVQMLAKSHDEAADRVMEKLVASVDRRKSAMSAVRLGMFAAQSADSLLLAPPTVRLVARSLLELHLAGQPCSPELPSYTDYSLGDQFLRGYDAVDDEGDDGVDDAASPFSMDRLIDVGGAANVDEMPNALHAEDYSRPLLMLLAIDSQVATIAAEETVSHSRALAGDELLEAPTRAKAYLTALVFEKLWNHAQAVYGQDRRPVPPTVAAQPDPWMVGKIPEMGAANFMVWIEAARCDLVSSDVLIDRVGLDALFISEPAIFATSERQLEGEGTLADRILIKGMWNDGAPLAETFEFDEETFLVAVWEHFNRSRVRLRDEWVRSRLPLLEVDTTATDELAEEQFIDDLATHYQSLLEVNPDLANQDPGVLWEGRMAQQKSVALMRLMGVPAGVMLGLMYLLAVIVEHEAARLVGAGVDVDRIDLGCLQPFAESFISRITGGTYFEEAPFAELELPMADRDRFRRWAQGVRHFCWRATWS
jgi:hypothetical protein